MTEPAVRTECRRSRRPDLPHDRSDKTEGLHASNSGLTGPSAFATSVRLGKHNPSRLGCACRVSQLLVAEHMLLIL
jgi:hypothetical protein